SGLLDFREFLAGVWNYCTYDSALIAKLCFGIFDVDKRGKLSPPELDALVRMLSGTAMADADALRQCGGGIGCNGDGTCRGDISYAEFAARTAAGAQALRPAFELQRAMRRKFLGVE
ncbi:unnamed protein product, partial [Phaeothamnion confervicola]